MARGIVKLTRRQLQRELKATRVEVDMLKSARNRDMLLHNDHQKALKDELKALQDSTDLKHLAARTELIKAMSWAMKACSSVMWSEKQAGWDYSRLRAMDVMQVRSKPSS